MTKAITYSRFSPRPDAATSESNATQLSQCHAYCKQHGYVVVADYNDPDTSGKDESRQLRAGLWQAIDALKRGYVLVTANSDRIARNVYLHELIFRDVERKQARIEYVTGHNGWSHNDRMIQQMLAVLNEHLCKMNAAKTAAAMLQHQVNGRAMSQQTPYGRREGVPRQVIDKDGNPKLQRTLIDDDDEQRVIQQILAWRASGLGYRQIARTLNEERVPCRGAKFYHPLIRHICQRHEKEPVAPAGR